MGFWEEILRIVGFSLELLGALLSFSRYINFPLAQIPKVLLSALLGTKYAKGVAFVYELTPEDTILVLRGIGLIVVGFIVHLSPDVITLVMKIRAVP